MINYEQLFSKYINIFTKVFVNNLLIIVMIMIIMCIINFS
jgi:hypothetical protein